MQKIYVVTRGNYSDYGISAIFTTKELAQAYINAFESEYADFNNIEEYELNPHELDITAGRKAYFLRMDVNGNTCDLAKSDNAYGFEDNEFVQFTHDGIWINVYCFANDEQHAIKIANEKRAQIIAMNQWGKSKTK